MLLGVVSQPSIVIDVSQEQIDHAAKAAVARGAEHLVASDLSFAGLNCFSAAAGLPYDLVLETSFGLARIQVKCGSPRTESRGLGHKPVSGYIFDGRSYNRRGLKSYVGEADLFAFVAIDLRQIVYMRVCDAPSRLLLSPQEFTDDRRVMSLSAVLNG